MFFVIIYPFKNFYSGVTFHRYGSHCEREYLTSINYTIHIIFSVNPGRNVYIFLRNLFHGISVRCAIERDNNAMHRFLKCSTKFSLEKKLSVIRIFCQLHGEQF